MISTISSINLAFTIVGRTLPADHGFALFGAISRLLPRVHDCHDIAIHPIRGRIIGDRTMQVTEVSRLVIRMPTERISEFLSLAGRQLIVAGCSIRIGTPQVFTITPSSALRSRLVVIKVSGDKPAAPSSDEFQAALRRKLDAFPVSSDCKVSLGKRRTLRVHHKEVVGYEVIVDRLSADESLALQSNAPQDATQRFARNHMGCGIFTGWSQEDAK